MSHTHSARHDGTAPSGRYSCNPTVTNQSLLRALLLLIGILPAVAMATNQTAEPLDPDMLVARVLTGNAGLAAMRSAVDAAQARITSAGALPDPQLSGAVAPETIGGLTTPSGDERSANIRMEVSQEFPWPGTLGLRADTARKEAAAAGDNVAAVRLRLAATTRAAYAQWHYVHQALKINSANSELIDELRQVAESRYAAGLARQQDVLQAEVELQHLKHQRLQLNQRRRTIRAGINRLLNHPATAPLPAPAGLPRPNLMPDQTLLQHAALARHPELGQFEKRVAANRHREALAQKDFYPDFKIFTGYNGLWDVDDKRWTAGASISLPLSRGKYRAMLDETRANTRRLGYELEDRRAQLLSQLEQAYAMAEEAAHEMRLYEEELIPLTLENLSAARSEYGSGGGSFSDVITAEQLKLNAELELERARADYYVAWAELERWTGGERPPASAPATTEQQPSGDS